MIKNLLAFINAKKNTKTNLEKLEIDRNLRKKADDSSGGSSAEIDIVAEIEKIKANTIDYIEQTKIERLGDKEHILFEPQFRSDLMENTKYRGIKFDMLDNIERYRELEKEQEKILKWCKEPITEELELKTILVEHEEYKNRTKKIRSELEKIFTSTKNSYIEYKSELERQDQDLEAYMQQKEKEIERATEMDAEEYFDEFGEIDILDED